MRGFTSLALAALLLLICACCPRPPVTPLATGFPPPEVMPSYGELARQYNQNLQGLERLWARADVELHWTDEEGERHFERFDGKLITMPPERLVLSLEKAGFEQMLAGANELYYWLINLHEKPRQAWFGRQASVGRPSTEPLPLPVHPRELMDLMGLVPLPDQPGLPEAQESELPGAGLPGALPGGVGWSGEQGVYVVLLPQRGARYLIHPQSLLPMRIELLDDAGRVQLGNELREHGAVEGTAAQVARRHEITLPQRGDRIDLALSGLTTSAGRVKPRLFDLDFLLEQVYKIDPAQRHRLDEAP